MPHTAPRRTSTDQWGEGEHAAWATAHAIATVGPPRPHAIAPTLITTAQVGSDRRLRNGLFVPASFAHPAKLHLGLIAWLACQHTDVGDHILDPMGGIGSTAYAAMLQRDVTIREIEPAWVALARENARAIVAAAGMFAGTVQVATGDATQPWGAGWGAVLCSPPYGCRAAPSNAWLELLDRPTPGSWGAEAFHYGDGAAQLGHLRGRAYWQAMAQVYAQAAAALRPGGVLLLVLKDHIRNGHRVWTTDATIWLVTRLGLPLTHRYQRPLTQLSLWTRRRRERGLPTIAYEDVLVFQRPHYEGA